MKIKLIFTIIVINLIYFYFGLKSNGLNLNELYKIYGDSISYIESCENLINGKGFTFFKTNEDVDFISNFYDRKQYDLGIYYAFRSPGFAFFYIPLRWVFNQHYAIICFLFLQVVLTAIAKYFVAKIAELFTKSKIVFWVILITINATPYFVQYNNLILTEALGFSFLVFGLYIFIRNQKIKNQKSNLILSGLFFTIAFMLRPFLIVFPISLSLYILVDNLSNFKYSLYQLIFFIVPIILITSTWTIRNYIFTKKIIPLADTLSFQNHKHLAFFEIKKMSLDLGYSGNWFDQKSPVYWYVNICDERKAKEVFYRNNFIDMNFFDSLKSQFHLSLNKEILLSKRREIELQNVKNIYEYKKDFKISIKERIKNKFAVFYEFIYQKNNKYFHSFNYPFNILLVFIQSLVLKSILFLGILTSLIYIFLKPFNFNLFKIIVLTNLFLVFYFCFILRLMEERELYTYSFLLLIIPLKVLIDLKNNNFLKLFSVLGLIYVLFLTIHQTSLEIKW